MRVLGRGLEAHQVDDVDDAHLQLGQPLAQDRRRGERLERRHVAAARHHDVGLLAVVVRRPVPDADSAGAVGDRVLHRQELERGLLAGDDDVDVVAAAQAVVGDREEAVRVRRQVDADDLRLLVHDVVDEAGILVREAVVVLAPDVRAEQVVQRRDRAAPRDVARHLQPLRVLVEHRVDDVDEGLVAVEEAVPSGEEVALEPALALVLGEHLQHAAVAGEVLVGRQRLGVPRPVGRLEDRAEPVRVGLVRAEEAEAASRSSGRRRGGSCRAPASPRRTSSPVAPPRPRSRGSPERERLEQQAAVRVRVGAHPPVALSAGARRARPRGAPCSSNSSSGR